MNKMKFISSQDDWNELLGFISKGTITPVIGQEIFKYKENAELFSLARLLRLSLQDL